MAARKLIQGEPTAENVLAALDDLLVSHGTVIVVLDAGHPELPLLLEHMDRVLLLATEDEAGRLAKLAEADADRTEIALVGAAGRIANPSYSHGASLRWCGTIDPNKPARDVAWLGRHLTRTKLGLAAPAAQGICTRRHTSGFGRGRLHGGLRVGQQHRGHGGRPGWH